MKKAICLGFVFIVPSFVMQASANTCIQRHELVAEHSLSIADIQAQCPNGTVSPPTKIGVTAGIGNLGYLSSPMAVSFDTHRTPTYTPIATSGPNLVNVAVGGSVTNLFPFAAGADNPMSSIAIVQQPSIGNITIQGDHYTYTAGAGSYRVSAVYAVNGSKGDASFGVLTFDVGANGGQPNFVQPFTDELLTTNFATPVPGGLPVPGSQVLSLIPPLYGSVIWSAGQDTFQYMPTSGYSGPDTFAFLVQTADNFQQVICVHVTVAVPQVTSATFVVKQSVSGNVTYTAPTTPVYGTSTINIDKSNAAMFSAGDGPYDIVLIATDGTGDSGSDVTHVLIDNTPPTCSWLDPTAQSIVHGSINGVVDTFDATSGVRGVDFVDPIDSHHSSFVKVSGSSHWMYSTYDTREKEGSLSLQAVVYDVAGNVGTCTQPVLADNNSPTGSVAFNPNVVVYNGLSLMRGLNTVSATGADDPGSGVATTALLLDGVQLNSANTNTISSALNTNGYADGTHLVSAAFTDRAGNTGNAQASVVIDNAAPVVGIVAPANSAVVSGSLPSVSASVIEANGIAEEKLFIDNVEVPFTNQSGVLTLSAPVTSNGTHTVMVTAKDTVGNAGQDQRSFVIVNGNDGGGPHPGDGGPIAITVIGVGNGTVLPGNTSTSVTVVVTGGDNTPTVTTQLDGGSPTTITVGAGGTYSAPIDTTGMSDGSHTITYTATDDHGHAVTTTITVIVDNSAPTITATVPTENQTLTGTISMQGSATDQGPSGIANIGIYVDGVLVTNTAGNGSSATVGYGFDTQTLNNGVHTIEFRATDRAGNMSSLVRHVTVQNGPGNGSSLALSVIYPTDGLSLSGAFYAVVSVNGNADSVGVRIDGGAAIAMTATDNGRYQVLLNVTQYTEGFHALEFVAANVDGSVSKTIQVYFDKTTPTLTIDKPVDNGTLALVQTLIAHAADGGRNLESVRFVLNGTTDLAYLPGNSDPTNTTYSYQWDTSAVADGDYTLTVIAKDKSGLVTQETVPFHVNNTNIPVSPATVEFRYSNAVASSQSGPFIVGPILSVSAIVSNATIDLSAFSGSAFQVYINKDGGRYQVPSDRVSVDGNTLRFAHPIPANARVTCVVRVLDSNGKLIQRTEGSDGSIISAMPADQGGTVLSAPDGNFQMRVPPNALTEDALVEVTPLPSNAPELNGSGPSSESLPQTVVYGPLRISGTGHNGNITARLQLSASLLYQRPPSEMNPTEASSINEVQYLDINHNWAPLDKGSASLAGSGAPQGRTISASLTTFGVYRIIAMANPGDGVTELAAYPSPLRAGSENATIAYLLGNDADCDVTIYSALGSLVRTYHFGAGSNGGKQDNHISWDGRNGAGDVVANGAYIIQVASGGHRSRVKIGVAK